MSKQVRINESKLTKGHLRKLNAIRKSIGPEIADQAFAEWLATQPKENGQATDPNAQKIADALAPALESGKLRIPRGGYMLRRGRGRVVVEPVTP